MKAPSLQKTAALSAFLHLTLFLVAAVVLRQSNHMNLPSPYIVDLVTPSGRSVVARTHHPAAQTSRKSRKSSHTKSALPVRQQAEKMKKMEIMKEKLTEKREARRVEDRIAELAAIKRIKEMSRLREVISIPAKGEESDDAKQTSQPQAAGKEGKGTGQTMGSYMDRITGEIWSKFYYPPDTGDKNLETVISVLISKDGTITVKKIEKPSGNRIFDRSALAAIKNASPVTPPPDGAEMELGIRFVL